MILDDLALSFAPLAKDVILKMLERFNTSENIFSLSYCDLTANEGLSDKDANKLLKSKMECYKKAEEQFELANDMCIKIISYNSCDYPPLLKECEDAPIILYAMGSTDFSFKDEKWISIIGTRKCSKMGHLLTEQIIDDIANRQKDTVIVGGLSFGVEAIARNQALKRNIRVVGVLVTSLNEMSDDNRRFASSILAKNGTIITEYPLSSPFYKKNYMEHSRILGGISHATILVEADLQSNSLRAARFAESYGRSLFAFPGAARDDDYSGNNRLIKIGAAQLITDFCDVEAFLDMKKRIEPVDLFKPQLSPIEHLIYECLEDGKEHSDWEIMEKTGLNIVEFNSTIPFLTTITPLVQEFKGRIYMKR